MNKFIKNRVAQYFGFDTNYLNIYNRKRELVYARQMAMKLMKDTTRLSYAKIGKEFDRDHATAMHGCKTIVNLMKYDKTVKKDYYYLLQEIELKKKNDKNISISQEIERFKEENSLTINQRVNFNYMITLFRINLNN
jgi:hypothetical protein